MNKIWTDTEKNYIKIHAGDKKDRELAEELTTISGRTVTIQAVRKMRQKLGITKKHGRGICAIVQKQVPSLGMGINQPEKGFE